MVGLAVVVQPWHGQAVVRPHADAHVGPGRPESGHNDVEDTVVAREPGASPQRVGAQMLSTSVLRQPERRTRVSRPRAWIADRVGAVTVGSKRALLRGEAPGRV